MTKITTPLIVLLSLLIVVCVSYGQGEVPLVYEVADSELAQLEAKLLLYTGEVSGLPDDRLQRLDAIANYLLDQPAPTVPDELKVNLNTGSLVELMSLDGIGEAKGRAIIKSREADGPFVDWHDAMTRDPKVGIGPKTYEELIEEGRAHID